MKKIIIIIWLFTQLMPITEIYGILYKPPYNKIRKVVIITERNSKDWLCYSQAVDLGERIFKYREVGIEI